MEKKSGFTDEYGYSTLESLSTARNLNRWMYSVIKKHCKGEILEIGSGIGNITEQFLVDGKSLTVTELRDEYCDMLKEKFARYNDLKNVIAMDIADSDFETRYSSILGKYDTVIALNVLEHIDNRSFALKNCDKLLKPGGSLIILVPAFQSLYNQFDRELGHHLRFDRKSKQQLMESSGFQVVYQQYFNAAGIFGWWFSGSVLRREMIQAWQVSLFDCGVPLFRIIDLLASRFIGLSIVSVGVKK